MNRVVEKLGNYRADMKLTPTVKQFLTVMAEENREAKEALNLLLRNLAKGDEILDKLAQKDKAMAEELRAMLRMTIAPTIIHGGVKENIIPSECEAVFDCRILPGQTTAEALTRVKELLKDIGLDKLEFEIIQANEPSESPMDTPLYRLMVETIKEFEPNCAVAPVLLTGGNRLTVL
jgi:carboxypeptidase PM20D1